VDAFIHEFRPLLCSNFLVWIDFPTTPYLLLATFVFRMDDIDVCFWFLLRIGLPTSRLNILLHLVGYENDPTWRKTSWRCLLKGCFVSIFLLLVVQYFQFIRVQ